MTRRVTLLTLAVCAIACAQFGNNAKKIQGMPLCGGVTPTAGQALTWDGSTSCWGAAGAGSSSAEYDNGTCTTGKTISAAHGPRQKVLLTDAQTCALTFIQPSSGTLVLQLRVAQSSAGAFSGAISGGKWPGGIVPTITATSGAVDFVSCYLDGTNTYCVASQDFR